MGGGGIRVRRGCEVAGDRGRAGMVGGCAGY
jgi:hypothetical protein